MLGKLVGKVAVAVLLSTGSLGTGACGQVERSPGSREPRSAPGVVAIKSEFEAPEGSDAAPRVDLVRIGPDGSTMPIPTAYVDTVEFRGGQAAVTRGGQLHLFASNGSRAVLARRIDGLPTPAGDGGLVYAARFGQVVDVCWLTPRGKVRRLATFSGSATRLAPQSDGSVVFVGARVGGVSGVWIADSSGARCLTNCTLRVGAPWGDAYRAPPGDAAAIHVIGDDVTWQSASGVWQTVPVTGEP